MSTVGVIGGSGLYEIDSLQRVEEITVDTPFGAPSDAIISGNLNGHRMLFVPRHGRGHTLTPSEVPYRANIWALKSLGAEWCISLSAVGSLRGDIHPGHTVIIDQFIDRTKNRPSTFFGDGIVGHVAFGDPISPKLADALAESSRAAGATTHVGGTYVCMEGPAFSTRAESELYRMWGASVIGMTNLPEAKLAREAEIAYATVALATDFDCWHRGHDNVSVEAVIATLTKNVAMAKQIIVEASKRIPTEADPVVEGAAKFAVMTKAELIPQDRRDALQAILGKYW